MSSSRKIGAERRTGDTSGDKIFPGKLITAGEVGRTTSNLLTASEAADYLGVKTETLAQWRWRKTGPPFRKVGRSVRYSLDEIEQWSKAGAE